MREEPTRTRDEKRGEDERRTAEPNEANASSRAERTSRSALRDILWRSNNQRTATAPSLPPRGAADALASR